MIIYVPEIRWLITVADEFAKVGGRAEIQWKEGILVGSRVRAGTIFAWIDWVSSGDRTALKLPAGCSGEIFRRPKTKNERLHLESQVLLTLKK